MFCCLSEGNYMLLHLLVLIDGDLLVVDLGSWILRVLFEAVVDRKKKRSKKKEEPYK
ncbi:hypothetical protein POPTR_012G028432v4 [Populus trichocarpa]|uniref:Uncharacterized protein n=1 Tax=Populus trichocarpa TaxID=3694 RepID=A0ACC0S444_POPTR|nr:hypothetical protein POPTR_012G028432v4 [Populus trichocarpa]